MTEQLTLSLLKLAFKFNSFKILHFYKTTIRTWVKTIKTHGAQ